MKKQRKTHQLQMRLTLSEKAAIRRQARRAGMRMSDWVLSKVLPPIQTAFEAKLQAISKAERPHYAVAELNEMLTELAATEFSLAVSDAPRTRLSPYWENYVAAMIETAAAKKNREAPAWTEQVEVLSEPVFGSQLTSLRLHLLTNSPPAFRRRNIFIDSSIGDRV